MIIHIRFGQGLLYFLSEIIVIVVVMRRSLNTFKIKSSIYMFFQVSLTQHSFKNQNLHTGSKNITIRMVNHLAVTVNQCVFCKPFKCIKRSLVSKEFETYKSNRLLLLTNLIFGHHSSLYFTLCLPK